MRKKEKDYRFFNREKTKVGAKKSPTKVLTKTGKPPTNADKFRTALRYFGTGPMVVYGD